MFLLFEQVEHCGFLARATGSRERRAREKEVEPAQLRQADNEQEMREKNSRTLIVHRVL